MVKKITEKIKFGFKGFKYIFNLYLAIIAFKIFFKNKSNRDIITMGSSNGKYSDENVVELFKYLVKNNEKVFYIIDKDSTDLSKVNKIGKTLYRFSFKANLMILRSKIMIYDTSYVDLIRCNRKYISHIITLNIFHGIHGLKRIDNNNAEKRLLNDNYIISTSEHEKIIKESWGFPSSRIFITGLPRFDNLYRENKSVEVENIIFYMPTWRPWFKRGFLNPSEEEIKEFESSNYFKNIMSIGKSKELNCYLKEKDFTLEIYLHKLMQRYFKKMNIDFKLSNIKFLNDNINVQKQILKSKVLVTDYSSIFFDFIFLNKPIILYQFDKKEYYQKTPGSYIKHDEIDSLVVSKTSDLLKRIQKIIDTKSNKDNKQYENLNNKYIKYHDQNNCLRIYNCIKRI